jgi:hypothetical protein
MGLGALVYDFLSNQDSNILGSVPWISPCDFIVNLILWIKAGIQENIIEAMGIQAWKVSEREEAHASRDHSKKMWA